MKNKINKYTLMAIVILTSILLSYLKGRSDGTNEFIRSANKKILSCFEVIATHGNRANKVKKDFVLPSEYFLNEDSN